MSITVSPVDQARALAQTAGMRVRDDLVVVRVNGDDRTSWLNGQVTSDVRNAKPGQGLYALAVSVRGKIMADLWVLERGDHLAVLLPKAAQSEVLQSFERQIIMEDVELVTDAALRVISLQGPRARDAIAGLALEAHDCDELGHTGLFVLTSEAELSSVLATLRERIEALGGCTVDEVGYELARLRAGRGRYGCDFGPQNYPQEAGLARLAVSFNKGCYLGQEVVCTLENRGRLTRRLVRLQALTVTEPTPGAELCDAEGHAVGAVSSVARDPELGHAIALGYVKQAHAVQGRELQAGEARLQVLGLAGGD
jgi:folate-binding protein YgfZ